MLSSRKQILICAALFAEVYNSPQTTAIKAVMHTIPGSLHLHSSSQHLPLHSTMCSPCIIGNHCILRSVQGKQGDAEEQGQPVSRVHVDYTVKSGPERLQAVLPDEADKLMKTPFAVIQVFIYLFTSHTDTCGSCLLFLFTNEFCCLTCVIASQPVGAICKIWLSNLGTQLRILSYCLSVQVWRPLQGPVDDSPLGLIDASSVAKEDLMPYALYFPGRVGYNYVAKYNPGHRQAFDLCNAHCTCVPSPLQDLVQSI